MSTRLLTLGLVLACGSDRIALAEVVYDSYREVGVQWQWQISEAGETSSFDELPNGNETEGMIADYIHLAGESRFVTTMEFRTSKFGAVTPATADIIVRFHGIEGGLPGAAFWTGRVDGAVFELGRYGVTETLHPDISVPDEFIVSYELQNIVLPEDSSIGFGSKWSPPSVGSGDRELYIFDSIDRDWYVYSPSNYTDPSYLELRLYAIPAPPAACLVAMLAAGCCRRSR